MEKTGKWNDYIFAAILVYHLFARQWPAGGALQTVIDVMMGVSAILIILKYYILYKKKHHGAGKVSRLGIRANGKRTAIKNKRR